MELLAPEMTTAFGSALLHSLWQGTLIYCLLQLLLPLLPTAGARHDVSVIALLLLPLAFGVTFWWSLPDSVTLRMVTSPNPVMLLPSGIAEPGSVTGTNWRYWLTLGYFAGLLPAGCWLLRQQWLVHRLGRYGLAELPASWQRPFAELLAGHLPGRNIRLYASRRSGAVLALGFISPVVLFPLALVNQLTVEQARLVLLHEIAHLRHYDHLLNYLQQGLRVLFFYHPAAHLICRGIDREREYRCDDWVAGRTRNPISYAEALLAVGRVSQTPQNPLAMSISKTPFTQRIERLFLDDRRRSAPLAFLLFPVALLLLTAVQSGTREVGEGSYHEVGAKSPKAVETALEVARDSFVPRPLTQLEEETLRRELEETLNDLPTPDELREEVAAAIADLPTEEEIRQHIQASNDCTVSAEELERMTEDALAQLPVMREKLATLLTEMPSREELRTTLSEALENLPDSIGPPGEVDGKIIFYLDGKLLTDEEAAYVMRDGFQTVRITQDPGSLAARGHAGVGAIYDLFVAPPPPPVAAPAPPLPPVSPAPPAPPAPPTAPEWSEEARILSPPGGEFTFNGQKGDTTKVYGSFGPKEGTRENDIVYYLDGRQITRAQMNSVPPEHIKKITISDSSKELADLGHPTAVYLVNLTRLRPFRE